MNTSAWIVLLAPLAGFLVIALTYKVLPWRAHGWIGTLAIAVSFAASIATLVALEGRGEEERQVVSSAWDYAVAGGVDAQLSILIDPLSVLMICIVSGVSMLIHLYSVAYMASDRGYTRFFAYLNFFVFSMLLLVLAANFLLLIVGWAFVGAASYFLISFWYRRKTATAAGIKAFVINVLGDVGLVLGTFFILRGTGSVDFLEVFEEVPEAFGRNDGDLVAGALLLLVGAFAKSAQVPFHTWLPDAMEGPTPVSALIHAATMVTAGVYLIARMHPIFEQAPAAADVGAILGCATLLIAATIGLVVTDLKRVIAYSTMSQIGYMVMAVSSAAYAAGMFHLMTHAFFKALLFMAAGSVIAAMAGTQDLDKMGGFRARDAVHVRLHGGRRPRAGGHPAVLGLLLQGRDPRAADRARRLAHRPRRRRLHRRAADRDLHVPDDLPRVPRRARRAGPRARARPPLPRARAHQPGHGRGRGHGRRLPRRRPPHRRARGPDEGRDGRPGDPGDGRRRGPDPEGQRGAAPLPRARLPRLALLRGARADRRHGADRHGDRRRRSACSASSSPTSCGSSTPSGRPRSARASARCTGCSSTSGTSTRRIDRAFVRPGGWIGRFANSTIERGLVNGALVGGASGAVRAASAAVRGIQTGYLRYYAALLLVGLTGLGAYFLISA